MSEGLREELSRLGTEASNPRTAHIDEMGTMEALEAINDLDHEIAPAVRRVAQEIEIAFVPHASFPVQELLWTRPLGCVAAPHDDAQLLSVLKTFWQYHGQDATFFIVETRRQLLHIRHEEILYFESRGKSVYPHTLSGAAESFPARLDVVAARLAPYRYVRCHQSYLANLRHVRQLNKVTHQLTLSSGATIPISKQYYAQVIECLRADRA